MVSRLERVNVRLETGDAQVKYPGPAHKGLVPSGSTHGVNVPQKDSHPCSTFDLDTPFPNSRSCKTADQKVWGLRYYLDDECGPY